MPLKYVYGPDPKYLPASDILIGDMSDINYEYLLFNRPIILLANDWIRENWPEIGIKSDLKNLSGNIKIALEKPHEYESERIKWLNKTMYLPYENPSPRILKEAIKKSGYKNPLLAFIYGKSEVRKSNLLPLYNESKKLNFKAKLLKLPKRISDPEGVIYFGAHFEDLIIKNGFNVHLDHGLKGKGAANVELSMSDYKKNNFFPNIDLHITAGDSGNERTIRQLGPNGERALIGGYPKAMDLLNLNTKQNRLQVCDELGFNPDYPIITYASAGALSYSKPGGSLKKEVLETLGEIAESNKYNILIKMKNPKRSMVEKVYVKLSKVLNKKAYSLIGK